jgi:hypothetical protein
MTASLLRHLTSLGPANVFQIACCMGTTPRWNRADQISRHFPIRRSSGSWGSHGSTKCPWSGPTRARVVGRRVHVCFRREDHNCAHELSFRKCFGESVGHRATRCSEPGPYQNGRKSGIVFCTRSFRPEVLHDSQKRSGKCRRAAHSGLPCHRESGRGSPRGAARRGDCAYGSACAIRRKRIHIRYCVEFGTALTVEHGVAMQKNALMTLMLIEQISTR